MKIRLSQEDALCRHSGLLALIILPLGWHESGHPHFFEILPDLEQWSLLPYIFQFC